MPTWTVVRCLHPPHLPTLVDEDVLQLSIPVTIPASRTWGGPAVGIRHRRLPNQAAMAGLSATDDGGSDPGEDTTRDHDVVVVARHRIVRGELRRPVGRVGS